MNIRTQSFRQRARLARLRALWVLPLALALGVTACNDDPTEPEEPEIGTMRLTVGTQTLTYTEGGGPTTLMISGASTPVSATFLDSGGAALTLDGTEFEIQLIPANTGVLTFNRTTPFSGTLNRVSAGTTVVQIGVFHKLEGHFDFGTFDVSFTVQ